jgi:His-Xaa-Ser system radical SAM maturase HxsB
MTVVDGNVAVENTPSPYLLLPFRFIRFSDHNLLLVNEVGEHLFLKTEDFDRLLSYNMDPKSNVFLDLKGKHFLTNSKSSLAPVIDLLATKYRTKKYHLAHFTSLHMIVITLRCNHRCNYCHASSQEAKAQRWDMDLETARRVVEMVFQSPSPFIKIEFQGGEPLLNFDIVKAIVKYAHKLNKHAQKHLSFVLCSNLTLITKDILNFLKDHNILVSTSIDGPKDIHNANRILREGGSSYDIFIEKLGMTRSSLGQSNVSALMTTTKGNILKLKSVIDEYVRLGFQGVFLRALNPYGYAKKSSGEKLKYGIKEFIDAYEDAIKYIIKLNISGTYFSEYFATILLTRILTPFSTGFMDLQSPAGAGILGVIYNYDGSVYPTDEARMLAAMGDYHFRLGNVKEHTYRQIFNGDLIRKIVRNSCVEIIPGCHSCAYQQYCGADPIRAYSQQKDTSYMGNMPTSEFCKKHKAIISFFMSLIKAGDEDVMDVFWSWITRRPINEVRIP